MWLVLCYVRKYFFNFLGDFNIKKLRKVVMGGMVGIIF